MIRRLREFLFGKAQPQTVPFSQEASDMLADLMNTEIEALTPRRDGRK